MITELEDTEMRLRDNTFIRHQPTEYYEILKWKLDHEYMLGDDKNE